MKKKIIFVCNGNIHRSVIAEKYFTKLLKENNLSNNFSVSSYGIQGTKGTTKPIYKNLKEYKNEWEAALPTLQKFNIDTELAKHSFRKITPHIVKKATVIVAMDKKTYSEKINSLTKQFAKNKNKIYLFSELTQDHKDIQDLAGNNNFLIHKKVIENICLTLKKNKKTILDWTNNDK